MVRLGVAVLVALSVAGCGGGSEESAPRTVGGPTLPSVPSTVAGSAGPMSSAPGSSGPGPSTLAGPPVLPAVGKTNTKAGAEAFARWYIESYNYAVQHPDKGSVPAVAEAKCGICTRWTGVISALRSRGEHYDGPAYLPELTAEGGYYAGGADVVFSVKQPPSRRIDASGAVVKTTEESTGILAPTLVWTRGAWRVEEIRIRVDS